MRSPVDPRSIGVLAALLCAWGCKPENKINVVDTQDNGTVLVPNVVVTPDALLWPTTDAGAASTQTFNVLNDGDADLNVSAMNLYGSPGFTFAADPLGFTLAPSESVDVDVIYTGYGAEDVGQIQLADDDPGNPNPTVSLNGSARVPELQITPNPLSYGKVMVGCHREEPLTFANVGLATLTVSAIAQVGDGWSVDVPFALPLTLEPGQSTDVNLTVTAVGGEMTDQIYASANDPAGSHIATQKATGVTDPNVEEEFWQGDGPYDKGDILFFVDQSCSMTNDQATLQANFDSFASQLDALSLDWQVGVVTKDNACFNHGILTPLTPNVSTAFESAVAGLGGTYTEAGLILTDEALKQSVPGGCNQGFIRDGSKVTLIEVSDESDQSPNPWNTYVTDIRSMAPNASVTAIVGPVPNGCGGGGRYAAKAGSGYYEASVATGGAFMSICQSDWTSYFSTIANMTASGTLNTFHLQSQPDPASITVQVNGSTSSGWTYDATTNSIVFNDTSVPAPGAHIVVYFALLENCDG